MKQYPLARPSIGPEEIKAVTETLKSGVLSLGPKTTRFEKDFAKKNKTKFAVAVNSGTSGLHLAMRAAGIGAGDEVITSAFSFVASANCIMYVGAKPVFIDIDPVTYNLDPSKIEAAITKKTKAILVVHIFGQSADMGAIVKIAKKHKLKIIEDACESIGATHQGQLTGTFGESAVFAFYPNKQMTTGEGGMIVTSQPQVAAFCRSLANQGRGANMSWLDHQYLGYNYRLDEMSAALGIVQLKRLNSLIKKRRQVAAWYNQLLAKYPELVSYPRTAKGNTHTWFVYVVELAKGLDRDRVIIDLAKRGVASKPYFPSIHLFSFYRETFGYKPGAFPISEAKSKQTLALPFYIDLNKKDVQHIVSTLVMVLKKYGKSSSK